MVVSNAFRRSVPYSQEERPSRGRWRAALSPMPFGVQSLIPRWKSNWQPQKRRKRLQCLSAFSPLFPVASVVFGAVQGLPSPMPFGVQSLIPSLLAAKPEKD